MADPSLDPGSGDTGGAGPDRRSTTGMPRWVKVFLIVTLVVVLVVVILLITGGGHGPDRHMSTGGIGGPAEAGEEGRTVQVSTLDTMTFEPSSISVSAGETVTFAVTNAGQAVHESTLGDAATLEYACHQPDHYQAGMRGEITIA
jgi:uncharacterized cupredoxin-like copper-binding protein